MSEVREWDFCDQCIFYRACLRPERKKGDGCFTAFYPYPFSTFTDEQIKMKSMVLLGLKWGLKPKELLDYCVYCYAFFLSGAFSLIERNVKHKPFMNPVAYSGIDHVANKIKREYGESELWTRLNAATLTAWNEKVFPEKRRSFSTTMFYGRAGFWGSLYIDGSLRN